LILVVSIFSADGLVQLRCLKQFSFIFAFLHIFGQSPKICKKAKIKERTSAEGARTRRRRESNTF